MSLGEGLRAHARHARTRVAEGTKSAVAAGRDIARNPRVRSEAADLTASVVLETASRLVGRGRPTGETGRERVKRVAGTAFDAAKHLVGRRIEEILAELETQGSRR